MINKKVYTAFTLMFIVVFAFAQVPKICSAQQTQVDQGKARLAMSSVLGLDLIKYTVELTNYVVDKPAVYGGMTRETMVFNLTSAQNSISVLCAFVNNQLTFVSLSRVSGSFSSTNVQSPGSTLLDVTKNAVQRYHDYSGLQTASDALNILDSVSGTTPVNVTEGNLKLKVLTPDNFNSTSISWTRSINGANYPTGFSLDFYNGVLVDLSDLSSFYSIGNTTVAISRDQAISIAQKEAFSKNRLNTTLADGTMSPVTLELPNQPQDIELNTACRQPLVYSPLWQIQFFSSKPIGGTVGYQVGIWADTGEIQYSHLVSYHGVDNSGTINNNFPSSTPTSIASIPTGVASTEIGFQGWNSANQSITLLIVGIVMGIAFSAALIFLKQKRNK
jgi:hypothetical protein